MLKWTGQRGNTPLIGIGLEEGNLQKLREDKPIHIKGEDLGIKFDIVIYYGKDMKTLLAMTAGSVGPDTLIKDER